MNERLKDVATRCVLGAVNASKCVCSLGFARSTLGGSLQRSPIPLDGLVEGQNIEGREMVMKGKERGIKGRCRGKTEGKVNRATRSKFWLRPWYCLTKLTHF